eukprot:TRINITY_DN5588_c0_g1_i2.p1 TRINITY_DN5588_c0_g1~~TRINITY_DN5588_c0_g1_i2.p1  ORF type:complete len:257 (+),score=45.92 TRINITY_DN5588_c0_g1_i2:92-772(+)
MGDSLHLPGGADGICHLLKNLNRFFSPHFVPSDDDVLRVRVKTSGVLETSFNFRHAHFIVCDVGGQRSERRQWIKCFSQVDALIYLVTKNKRAINEYDLQMEEAREEDVIFDSIQQWKTITHIELFKETAFILFLNKIDLFYEKIKQVPLSSIFSDYVQFTGRPELNSLPEKERAIAFFDRAYKQTFGSKYLYVFPTCVLDKDLCSRIFYCIQDVIFQTCWDSTGM